MIEVLGLSSEMGRKNIKKEWLNSFLQRVEIPDDEQFSFKSFVTEKLVVSRLASKDVLYIDDSPDKDTALIRDQTKYWMRYLVADPLTSGVFIEYFSPELKHNARKSFIYKALTKGGYFNSHQKTWHGTLSKVFSFDYLTQLALEYEKPVYVADTANRPDFQVTGRLFDMYFTAPAVGIAYYLASKQTDVYEEWQRLIISGSLFCATLVAELGSSTFFTADERVAIEPWLLHGEDTRRVFVAKATREILEKNEGKQYLLVYPGAHTNRIDYYIHNPPRVKEMLYKIIYPYLEFQIRQYRKRKSGEHSEFSGFVLLNTFPL